MKRFWTAVTVERTPEAFQILLDQRPVRTPARALLWLPTGALAEAIAAEWAEQGDKILPRSMPLTGLANAAIDRVMPDRIAFAQPIARFAESDLLYYRADRPARLADRQAAAWDPLLGWARRRFDIDIVTGTGVVHLPQPATTLAALRQAVAGLDAFRLAALSPLTTIGGSLIAALAVVDGTIDPAAAWDAVSIDDRFQLEEWGHDDEAVAALDALREDFAAAARFVVLLG